MVKSWRIFWRMSAFFGWTLALSLFCFIFSRNSPRGIRRATAFTRWWCRGVLFLTGVKTVVHGGPADFGGRLVISNHSSYLDILIHGAITRLRFAAKKEVRHYPVLGMLIAPGMPIWVNRESPVAAAQTLSEFRRSLDIGVNLIVYPEGTTSDGQGALRAFKSTVFQAVCGTDYPIQPIITRTRVAADGFNPAWYGDMTMWPHMVRLLSHRYWHCDLYVLPPQYARPGETRKELAERMHGYMDEVVRIIDSGDGDAIAGLLA